MRLFTVTLLIAILSSFTALAQVLTKTSPSIKVQQSVKTVKKHNTVKSKVKSTVKNSAMNHQEPIWFYDVTSEAYQDLDQDGYFQNFTLNFDLDTDYSSLDVFVDIAFINQYGNSELVYTSDLFTLNGDSEHDNQQFDFQFFEIVFSFAFYVRSFSSCTSCRKV